jgi:hypothetical protein
MTGIATTVWQTVHVIEGFLLTVKYTFVAVREAMAALRRNAF